MIPETRSRGTACMARAGARRCKGPGRWIYHRDNQPFAWSCGPRPEGAARWQPNRRPRRTTTTSPAPMCSTPTARAQGYHLNMFCMSLMKAENRKAFKDERGEVSRPVSADARAARGDPQAPVQPDAGTRRQHLFHRQARRDRRPSVPASCGADDRLDPAGLRRPDAARRPHRSRATAAGRASTPRPDRASSSDKSKPKASKGKKRRG